MPRRTSSEKPLPQAPRHRQPSSRQEPDPKPAHQHYANSVSTSSTSGYGYGSRESQQPPIHKQVVYFVRTVPGLERMLRLVQAVAQVVTEVAASSSSSSSSSSPWKKPRTTAAKGASLKGQLALSMFSGLLDEWVKG